MQHFTFRNISSNSTAAISGSTPITTTIIIKKQSELEGIWVNMQQRCQQLWCACTAESLGSAQLKDQCHSVSHEYSIVFQPCHPAFIIVELINRWCKVQHLSVCCSQTRSIFPTRDRMKTPHYGSTWDVVLGFVNEDRSSTHGSMQALECCNCQCKWIWANRKWRPDATCLKQYTVRCCQLCSAASLAATCGLRTHLLILTG